MRSYTPAEGAPEIQQQSKSGKPPPMHGRRLDARESSTLLMQSQEYVYIFWYIHYRDEILKLPTGTEVLLNSDKLPSE